MLQLASTPLERLADVVRRGGPEPSEYAGVAEWFRSLRAMEDAGAVAVVFAPTLTPDCIHGYGHLKPRGYAGDFEMIDRIYTGWVSPNPRLARWDLFFHAQPAPRAVRNRKEFFKGILRRLDESQREGSTVLNVGCGPGRDVAEYFQDMPGSRLRVLSIDLDADAIRHAETLSRPFADRAVFACENVFRYTPEAKYDLVWAAGLFDYFSDRLFVRVAKRLLSAVRGGGELVIGNFGPDNSSRTYMEVLGQWHLEHRSMEKLLSLAADAGIAPNSVRVEQEPEGVNLFLRIAVPA